MARIIIDEDTKDLILFNNDGKEISRYSYRNVMTDDFTIDDLKNDIESFNITLSRQSDINDIKELAQAIKIHSW